MSPPRAMTIARCLFVAAVGTVLALSATFRAAEAYWRADPAHAPRFIRSSPGLRLADAETRRAGLGWQEIDAPEVAANARAVLVIEPLEAVALRQLAELEPNSSAKTRQLLQLSDRVTRRDMIGQILLINVAAGANDFGEALAHYDRALSVQPQLASTLLPVLANGLTDPGIVKELSKYASRPWFPPLLFIGVEQGAPVSAITQLALYAQPQRLAERDTLASELIDKQLAVERRDNTRTRTLVSRLGGDRQAILDDLAFNPATTRTQNYPLSWRLTDDGTIETTLLPPAGLVIRASPAGAGIAATRVSLLKPGIYRLSLRLMYDLDAPRAALLWDVACADGRSLWKAELPHDREGVTIDASMAIPDGCGQQMWRLDVRADDSRFASTARISWLAVRPK